MDDLIRQANDLRAEVDAATERIGLTTLVGEKAQLDQQIAAAGFWQDAAHAQEVVKQQAKLERRLQPWQKLQQEVRELGELADMQDASMRADLTTQLADGAQRLAALKEELKFAGPYDDHDVILSIYAGAGGTDAQDWAGMLLRMYVRWAEQNGFRVHTIDESAGDEAGIKSVTIEIGGDFAYGKLKGEHGVHRLVRLSPFNAAASRETSFAKVDVLPKIDQPEAVELDDKDLRIDVYRSGGHGGQSVNTTDSAVRITHLPTGISVAIQNERSQLQNKETALTILRSRLIQLQMEQHKDTISDLKGPSSANEFGSQIRNYVLHPYKQVKDLRTGYETSDPDGVLGGNVNPFIDAYLDFALGDKNL
ncbi:MAG TPA: peptide chain release factor 2 [Candidatus Saccharimonadales bacterium]|nr:peptide chain release factor 2 [Candidatus Saccharimonadales bacterium]